MSVLCLYVVFNWQIRNANQLEFKLLRPCQVEVPDCREAWDGTCPGMDGPWWRVGGDGEDERR